MPVLQLMNDSPLQSFAMTFPHWDRIYVFAFSATVFAVLGYLFLLFVPVIEIAGSANGETTRRTLLADGQTVPLLVSLLPVVLVGGTLLAIPRHGPPNWSGKINLWLTTFLLYIFVAISILSVGILFVPSAILITAAAVGSMVRRRAPGPKQAQLPQESKSGRGGGKRRRNRG